MTGFELPLWTWIMVGVIGVPVFLFHLGQCVFKMKSFYDDYQEGCRWEECLRKGWELIEENKRKAAEEEMNDLTVRLESLHIGE